MGLVLGREGPQSVKEKRGLARLLVRHIGKGNAIRAALSSIDQTVAEPRERSTMKLLTDRQINLGNANICARRQRIAPMVELTAREKNPDVYRPSGAIGAILYNCTNDRGIKALGDDHNRFSVLACEFRRTLYQ